jgi:hypothetical protein
MIKHSTGMSNNSDDLVAMTSRRGVLKIHAVLTYDTSTVASADSDRGIEMVMVAGDA